MHLFDLIYIEPSYNAIVLFDYGTLIIHRSSMLIQLLYCTQQTQLNSYEHTHSYPYCDSSCLRFFMTKRCCLYECFCSKTLHIQLLVIANLG